MLLITGIYGITIHICAGVSHKVRTLLQSHLAAQWSFIITFTTPPRCLRFTIRKIQKVYCIFTTSRHIAAKPDDYYVFAFANLLSLIMVCLLSIKWLRSGVES